MANTREYVSPSGGLRFLVVTGDDGDIALGFDGFPWHTHADMLAAASDLTEAIAVEQFLQELLGSRAVIAVLRVGGKIKDVWVTDDPGSESCDLSEGESVELRLWDGRKWPRA
jgi:hypothetical protein